MTHPNARDRAIEVVSEGLAASGETSYRREAEAAVDTLLTYPEILRELVAALDEDTPLACTCRAEVEL